MPEYSVSLQSFTLPDLPPVSADGDHPEAIRSSLIPGSFAAAKSPLRCTLSLPSPRARNPIHPATHVKLSYTFKGSGEIFVADSIQPEAFTKTHADDEASTLYDLAIAAEHVACVKVNEGETPDGEANLFFWKNEKILNKVTVGPIKGLGIEGLKSFDVARRRVENWKEQAAKKAPAGQ